VRRQVNNSDVEMPWRRAVDDTSRGPLKLSSFPGELKPVFETMLANANPHLPGEVRGAMGRRGRRLQGCDTRSAAGPCRGATTRTADPAPPARPSQPSRTHETGRAIADLREEEAGDATGAISNP